MVDQMKTELRARKSRPPTSLSNSPREVGIVRLIHTQTLLIWNDYE
jgi:hypothetical protein